MKDVNLKIKKKQNYLDKTIINNFRDTLNSSPIFTEEDEYKCHWNLICAMMDRVDSCVNYINCFNISNFETEECLINYLTYCCILNDSIVQLFNTITPLNNFYEDKIKNREKFFKDDYVRFINEYDKNSKVKTLSDDKFFEFFRSISFAHPLETSRPRFMKKDDRLYSPFVFNKNIFNREIKNPIGIAIYSLKDYDKTIHFWFSANHLMDFIYDKYSLLNIATDWLNGEIKKHEIKWNKKKVNRNLHGTELLLNIKEILNERHADTIDIDCAVDMLKCNITDKNNISQVTKYREALMESFDELSDWIDSLQSDDKFPKKFYNLLYPTPETMYPQSNYEIGKINSYLDDRVIDYKTYIKNRNEYIQNNCEIDIKSDFEWGLFNAELFFYKFGNIYVNFDLTKIKSANEIKLLTNTALFMEMQQQITTGKVSDCIINLINENNLQEKKLKVLKKMEVKTNDGKNITISFVDASKKNNN